MGCIARKQLRGNWLREAFGKIKAKADVRSYKKFVTYARKASIFFKKDKLSISTHHLSLIVHDAFIPYFPYIYYDITIRLVYDYSVIHIPCLSYCNTITTQNDYRFFSENIAWGFGVNRVFRAFLIYPIYPKSPKYYLFVFSSPIKQPISITDSFSFVYTDSPHHLITFSPQSYGLSANTFSYLLKSPQKLITHHLQFPLPFENQHPVFS